MIKKVSLIAIILCTALILSSCRARNEEVKQAPDKSAESGDISSDIEVVEVDERIPDTSFETVAGWIDLAPPDELIIARPVEDISVNAEYYYITGCSDPSAELLLNDEPVESRGKYGSFGIYAELDDGVNVFTFTQGDVTQSVSITRTTDDETPTTDIISNPFPSFDVVTRVGDGLTISCVAPSGSAVTAQIGESSYELKQVAITESDGIPAIYRAVLDENTADGVTDLGAVSYRLSWNGKTSDYTSKGSILVADEEDAILVGGSDSASTLFTNDNLDDAYYSTIRRDGLDVVTDISGGMYKLGIGGWVLKEAVKPLIGSYGIPLSMISSVEYSSDEKSESIVLKGAKNPTFRSDFDEGIFTVTLANTSADTMTKGFNGGIISSLRMRSVGKNTELAFTMADGNHPWGWDISYDGEDSVISFNARPELGGGDFPLDGLTVLLDPGHGGNDVGAFGVPRDNAAAESEINAVTAKAVNIYLEGMGATVFMTDDGTETIDLNTRIDMVKAVDADIFLSLHSNSILSGNDGTKPNGVEIHYFDPGSAFLSEKLLEAMCEKTGRNNREVRNSYYKVTLGTYAPSALIEMGFLTNAVEYDSLCDSEMIYKTAEAIGEAIIKTIQGRPDDTENMNSAGES